MTDTLSGRVVLLTGASGGIGRRLAVGLAREGAELSLHYHHDHDQAEALVDMVRGDGGRPLVVQGDLTDPAQAAGVVSRTIDHFGQCDVLFNNAGAASRAPFLDVTPEMWRQAFALNVDSAFFCTRAVAPQMIRQGGGKIVNTGSITGILATTSLAGYGSAKAALHMLTKVSAVALAPYRITVNAIAPGVVTTEKLQIRLRNPLNLEPVKARTPTGDLVRPEDIVGLAIFLSSSLSDHVTGQIITVDHGYTIQGLEWQPEALGEG